MVLTGENLGNLVLTFNSHLCFKMLFEVFFSKAVMSGGFSLVLQKAPYFELSCVTLVVQAVCCLYWPSSASPNSSVYNIWPDTSWNELCNRLAHIWLRWMRVITCEVTMCISPCSRWKAVFWTRDVSEMVSNNRVSNEKWMNAKEYIHSLPVYCLLLNRTVL